MTDSPTDPRVQNLADHYSGEAQVYDEFWAPVLLGPAQLLLEKLNAKSPRRVLDVGTGVGTFLPALRKVFSGAAITGVDLSPGMLARIPGDVPRAVMDASRLAIAAGSVDVVTLVFMLFHLPDPLHGLTEARRVLRRGGRVATVTWGDDFESPATRLWNAELEAFGADPLDAGNILVQHELVDTPEKMDALMRGAGFVSIQATTEVCEHEINMDHLIRLRTGMGRHRMRFHTLGSEAQAEFLASTKQKLAALDPEDFVCRGVFVYCVGSAG